ncbi:hypothetical protein FQR65_LT09967 [Abscondita terminalis]|nr:hypothetical protein FQR65_LT09967 [Abscondita terminalis]
MALNIVILSILSVLVTGVFSDDDYHLFNTFKDKIDVCINEIKVEKGLVKLLFQEGVFTEDNNLKCFLQCLHVKLNFITVNGVANVEEMKKVILPLAKQKDKASEIIEKCALINESDKCEMAFKFQKCLVTY